MAQTLTVTATKTQKQLLLDFDGGSQELNTAGDTASYDVEKLLTQDDGDAVLTSLLTARTEGDVTLALNDGIILTVAMVSDDNMKDFLEGHEYVDVPRVGMSQDFQAIGQATLDADFDTTAIQGAGTNAPGAAGNVLTTGTSANDAEQTKSLAAFALRAAAPRVEIKVEVVTAIADRKFVFGLYKDADEYAQFVYDAAVDANWHLMLEDAVGAEDVDSGIALVADTPVTLSLWSEVDGTIHWEINGTEIAAGMTRKITAAAHSVRYFFESMGTAAVVANVSHLEWSRNK